MDEDFTIRQGRREDAAGAARLWIQSAEEHTVHDRVYETSPGAEKTMRRFLADVANSSYSFLFVAEAEDRTVGFIRASSVRAPRLPPKDVGLGGRRIRRTRYRNRGVGHALLQSVQAWARERDADGISLQVAAPTRGAASSTTTWGFGRSRSIKCSNFD